MFSVGIYPGGKKIPDEAVTPNVVVGQVSDEDSEEAPPANGDQQLNKALQVLKANNGAQTAQPAAQAAPAASASATTPSTPPTAEKKPGSSCGIGRFFRRLFGRFPFFYFHRCV